MKTIFSKVFVVGLGCALAINVSALEGPVEKPLFDNLPLCFTAASPGQFIANSADTQFLISPAEAQVELQKTDLATKSTSLRTVRMKFVGADSQAEVRGSDELPGKINYLIGNNPAQWNTGIATYARLRVEQLYPGINLVYYGNHRQLEYDLSVAPGASPDGIRIRFDGVDEVSIGARGELVLNCGGSEIWQQAPILYQMVEGRRQIVSGGYRLLDSHTIGFTVQNFNHNLPLVIDPILNFSTYFGGSSGDIASSVVLDTNGFIYVAGNTLSSQFPTNSRPNGFQTNFGGGGILGDAYVAKFDKQGSNLIYFTYLGGNADDAAYALTVDSAGHAYIAGATDSPNFPVTNAIPSGTKISGTINQYTGGYLSDAFVTELETNGSSLIYSTYLGGGNADAVYGIALDSSDNAYVTGFTYSTNFPTSQNAFQKLSGVPNSPIQAYYNANAFMSEIADGGSNLLYSTYLGGTNYDWGKAIAVDSSNNVYIAGLTSSTNFPTTNAIFQEFVQTNGPATNQVIVTNVVNGYLLNGSTGPTTENQSTPSDAFVAEFSPGCSNLIYSTLLGGTNNDVANGIAVDALGNAYITGWTVSTNYPNTITNVAELYNGLANNAGVPFITNALLTQVTWNGSNAAIGFSTAFGGTNFGIDMGNGVTLDSSGNIYVIGSSSTTNFPAVNTPGLLGTTNAGASDAFVIAFTPNASAILYSGYFGGSGNDFGYGIAVDSATNVFIAGQTASAKFPVLNARQSTLNGSSDAFIAKIGWVNLPPNITTQPTNQAVGVGTFVSLVTTATGTPPLTYQWQELGTNSVWTNVVNRANVSGATNATLFISNSQTTNSGSYQLVITNYAGSITSQVAVVTITNVSTTLNPLAGQTVAVGSTVSFNVSGSAGTGTLTFQWQKDGTNLFNGTNAWGSIITGATNDPLKIANAQTNDSGNYWLIVSDAAGSVTSTVASLTVTEAPIITVEPTNQTVGLGSRVSFVVSVVGVAPLTDQWLFDGTNLTDGPNIGGSTNTILVLTNAQTSDNGSYLFVVTNSFGSATSSPPAILTVLTAPTFMNVMAGTNGSIVVSGTGGTNGANYIVYASTNLAIPFSQWTPVQVNGNQFGSQGQFIFTNTPPPDTPQRFYILEMPSP